MPKVTDAYLETRRQQILSAAATCFAKKGFHQSSMQDICHEARLSPGAVYRYFRSKEQIIEGMAQESLQRNLAIINSVKASDDTQEVFEALSHGFFSMLDSPDQRAALCVEVALWAEAQRNPRVRRILLQSLESHRSALIEVVRNAQRRGDLNPSLEPSAVVSVMVSLFDGLVIQKLVDPGINVRSYVAVVKALASGNFWTAKDKTRKYADAAV